MFGGHIIFGTLLAGSLCLHLVSTDTCTAGAMPGFPGLPGFPGREGRQGMKGERGDPGKIYSIVLFIDSFLCKIKHSGCFSLWETENQFLFRLEPIKHRNRMRFGSVYGCRASLNPEQMTLLSRFILVNQNLKEQPL